MTWPDWPKWDSAFKRWRAYALRTELRLAPTEAQRLFVLTVLIGVVCGFAAVGFHFAIFFGEQLLIDRAMSASGHTWILWSVLSPTVGGLLCGVLLQFVFPGSRGSGIPQVKIAYASRAGVASLRDAIGKFITGSLQIASGASLGREGPTVQICSGIASTLGRFVQVSPQSRRRLIPVGAAAGIAAAFNAPIAAVTFTIEEVVGKLDQTVLSGVIIAAALAAVIERSVLGGQAVLEMPHTTAGVSDARSLVLYAALGVAAAFVSIAFTDGLLHLRARFRKITAIPDWAKPAIGGLVTGCLIVAVLAWLKIDGVNGGGYAVLKRALGGQLTVRVMLVLFAAKLVATVFSYSSGGAGGIFAPSLFMGAMLGGAFGSLDRTLFGHDEATLGAFALVGMGAVFSGTIRAPMTSVLIIIEMTSGYDLILPLMIANMSAYVLARHWRPQPIYEALLAQDGVHLRDRGMLDALQELRVDKHTHRDTAFACLLHDARAGDVVRAVRTGGGAQLVFPVVDSGGALVGILTSEDTAMVESEPGLELVVNATDMMRPPASVRASDDLRAVFELLRAEKLRELPVVDANGRVVSLIDEAMIAQAYLKASGPKSTRTL